MWHGGRRKRQGWVGMRRHPRGCACGCDEMRSAWLPRSAGCAGDEGAGWRRVHRTKLPQTGGDVKRTRMCGLSHMTDCQSYRCALRWCHSTSGSVVVIGAGQPASWRLQPRLDGLRPRSPPSWTRVRCGYRAGLTYATPGRSGGSCVSRRTVIWYLALAACASRSIPGSSSGRTTDSGSVNRGSNPRPGATTRYGSWGVPNSHMLFLSPASLPPPHGPCRGHQ